MAELDTFLLRDDLRGCHEFSIDLQRGLSNQLETAKWCPTMDLLAVVFKDGTLSMHRAMNNWQRLWYRNDLKVIIKPLFSSSFPFAIQDQQRHPRAFACTHPTPSLPLCWSRYIPCVGHLLGAFWLVDWRMAVLCSWMLRRSRTCIDWNLWFRLARSSSPGLKRSSPTSLMVVTLQTDPLVVHPSSEEQEETAHRRQQTGETQQDRFSPLKDEEEEEEEDCPLFLLSRMCFTIQNLVLTGNQSIMLSSWSNPEEV